MKVAELLFSFNQASVKHIKARLLLIIKSLNISDLQAWYLISQCLRYNAKTLSERVCFWHTVVVRLDKTAVHFQYTLFLLMLVKTGANFSCKDFVTGRDAGCGCINNINPTVSAATNSHIKPERSC